MYKYMHDALAWLALGLYIAGGLFKAPRTTMACFIAGNLAYMLHYAIIGLHTPAISMGMMSLVAAAILYVPKAYLLPTVIFGFACSSTMILAKMNNYVDVTLIMAAALVYFANFNRDHVVRFKLATIASQLLWVAFTLYHADIPMLICATGMTVTLSVSLIRHMGLNINSLRKYRRPAYLHNDNLAQLQPVSGKPAL